MIELNNITSHVHGSVLTTTVASTVKDVGTIYCVTERTQKLIQGVAPGRPAVHGRRDAFIKAGLCLLVTNLISAMWDTDAESSVLTMTPQD